MIYTPRQFLSAFVGLMTPCDDAHTVRVSLLPLGESSGANSLRLSTMPATSEMALAEDLLDVQVQFCAPPPLRRPTRPRDDRAASRQHCSGAVRASYRVVGSGRTITQEWCGQLQRLWSTVALFRSTTMSSLSEWEDTAYGALMRQTTPFAPSPFRFEVELEGVLPPMVWEPQLDGYFGAQHFVVQDGRVSCAVRKLGSATASTGGAAGQPVECPLGEEAAYPSESLAASSLNPCPPCMEFKVESAVLLNASMPLGRSIRPGQSAAVVVLHAPGRQLFTADVLALHADSRLPPLFEFMKRFTTQHVIPHVVVDCAAACWRHCCVQDGEAAEQLDGFDNVCGLSELGTSYAVDFTAKSKGTRVHSVVLLLNCPLEMWFSLAVAEGTGKDRSPEGYSSPSSCEATLLETVGRQLGEFLSNALRDAVSQNLDLFAFGVDSTPLPSESTKRNSRSGAYTDDMLRHSLSDSITKIIFSSVNPEFVREAETLLFGAALPSTAVEVVRREPLATHSFTEVRQTIEECLRRRAK